MRKKEFIISLGAFALATAPPAFAQGATSALVVAPAHPPPAASSQVGPAAADAVATLQIACLPILRGKQVKAAAQSAGFKLEDGAWVRPIAGKDEIDLDPPDAANPHVCTLTITAAPGDGAALRSALAAWAAAQSPPLAAAGVDQRTPGASQGWVTSTWSAQTAGGAESLVLTQPQPAGQTATQQQSTLLVSLSPT
jgi:hypothetical protein